MLLCENKQDATQNGSIIQRLAPRITSPDGAWLAMPSNLTPAPL